MIPGRDRWGVWDEDDVDLDDVAFGFHVEDAPIEDDDGYTEVRDDG